MSMSSLKALTTESTGTLIDEEEESGDSEGDRLLTDDVTNGTDDDVTWWTGLFLNKDW